MTDERTEQLARAAFEIHVGRPVSEETWQQVHRDTRRIAYTADALAAIDADPETYGYEKAAERDPACADGGCAYAANIAGGVL